MESPRYYPGELESEDYQRLMGNVHDYRMTVGRVYLTSEMVDFAAFCILKNKEKENED